MDVFIDYTWGAVDMIPDTDFPDIRKLSVIQSHHGACMVIPRENNLIRLYVQLSNIDIEDPTTGRIDRGGINAERLLEVMIGELIPGSDDILVDIVFTGCKEIFPSVHYKNSQIH